MNNETLTLKRLQELIAEMEPLWPERRDGMSLFGMPVYVAPEFPKVKLNYKCRTKYGDEFEFLTKEQQAETDAWLLRRFGTTSHIPENTFYVMSGLFGHGVHMSARDVVKVNCL